MKDRDERATIAIRCLRAMLEDEVEAADGDDINRAIDAAHALRGLNRAEDVLLDGTNDCDRRRRLSDCSTTNNSSMKDEERRKARLAMFITGTRSWMREAEEAGVDEDVIEAMRDANEAAKRAFDIFVTTDGGGEGDDLVCPRCGCEAYQRLEHGECREMDTKGSHRICSTEEGAYLHSYPQWSDDE